MSRRKIYSKATIDSWTFVKSEGTLEEEFSHERDYEIVEFFSAIVDALGILRIAFAKEKRPRLQGKPVGRSAQARFVNSLSSKDKKLACMFGIIKNNTAERKRAKFLAAKAEREHQEALEAEYKERRGVPTKEGFYISIKKMAGTYSIIEITAEQALSMDGVIAVGETAMKWLELNK